MKKENKKTILSNENLKVMATLKFSKIIGSLEYKELEIELKRELKLIEK